MSSDHFKEVKRQDRIAKRAAAKKAARSIAGMEPMRPLLFVPEAPGAKKVDKGSEDARSEAVSGRVSTKTFRYLKLIAASTAHSQHSSVVSQILEQWVELEIRLRDASDPAGPRGTKTLDDVVREMVLGIKDNIRIRDSK